MLRTVAAAVAVLCLCTSARLGAQVPQPTGYGVHPGDQITTDFYTAGGEALASVRGDRLVDREGNVFFPYVGTVHVEGLDVEGIRSLLLQKFDPFYNDPVITANVKLKVNITGMVGRPGHYFLDPTATIVEALSNAGGVGSELGITNTGAAADVAHVRLVREGQTRTLDLRPEIADPVVLELRIQVRGLDPRTSTAAEPLPRRHPVLGQPGLSRHLDHRGDPDHLGALRAARRGQPHADPRRHPRARRLRASSRRELTTTRRPDLAGRPPPTAR